MFPAIRPGDVLVVERAGANQVAVGDVVVMQNEGGLVDHRVISVQASALGKRIVTKGDAVAQPDRPADESEVLGKVASVVRRGRIMKLEAATGTGQRWVAKGFCRFYPVVCWLARLRHKLQHRRERILSCQP